MAKRIDRKYDPEEAPTITFTDIASNEALIVNLDDLPEKTKRHLMFHGANAKIGDSAADPNSNAIEVMKGVVAALMAGTWSTRSGGGGTRTTKLARAVALAMGKEVGESITMLEGLSEDKTKALRSHPKIKAAMAEIDRADAAKKIKETAKAAKEAGDLSELLG